MSKCGIHTCQFPQGTCQYEAIDSVSELSLKEIKTYEILCGQAKQYEEEKAFR